MSDPFDQLALPLEPRRPRASFARRLRDRVVAELGLDPSTVLPTVDLPERKPMPNPTNDNVAELSATPYLCVDDGAGAIAWYEDALGAVERVRVDAGGVLGHAELTVGTARFMLSEENPDLGVVSPRTLGGTSVTVHLEVADADATFTRAIAAGASPIREPADQPHGARHGSLVDPYGHRWILSQRIGAADRQPGASRRNGGFLIERGPRAGEPYVDGIWGVMSYRDPDAGIRFVTEVLGFEELVLVRGPDGRIVHSEYRWPEGGIVQIAEWDEANTFLAPPGGNGLYVITRRPQAVWERCLAAGAEVLRPPEEPHYDPGGMGFSVRDPEGNAWSFGSYVGGATS